ncbi:MAG: hypothetical protein V1735_08130 [Nanoarchaeota archaeon]
MDMRKPMTGKPPEQSCPPGKEFVFRTHDGKEIGKARNVSELVALLKRAPLDSVLYHANGGHFAPWLEFMGQRMLSAKTKTIKGSGEDVRKSLISVFEQ